MSSRYAARSRELGAFLRERRDRLRPEDVGLPPDLSRRTPGLRREEVAELAGLSPGYYTRLEQGHAHHPSTAVLAALARTLHLTPDEAEHLKALAQPVPTAAPPSRATVEPSASALRLMNLLVRPTAAVVLGRLGEVLAWNEAARLLFPHRFPPIGHSPSPAAHNPQHLFLDPASRDFYPDWAEVADDLVAHLRSAAGHLIDDPAFTALITELGTESPEFADRWSRRDVHRQVTGHRRINHPTFGQFTATYDVTALLDSPSQWLVVYSFPPETASALTAALTAAKNILSADVEDSPPASTSR